MKFFDTLFFSKYTPLNAMSLSQFILKYHNPVLIYGWNIYLPLIYALTDPHMLIYML